MMNDRNAIFMGAFPLQMKESMIGFVIATFGISNVIGTFSSFILFFFFTSFFFFVSFCAFLTSFLSFCLFLSSLLYFNVLFRVHFLG